MTCDRTRELILDGGEKTEEAVTAHLEECGGCRTWSDTWHEASNALKTLDAPPLPADFAHTVALKAAGERVGAKQGAARLGDRVLALLLGRGDAYAGSPLSLTLLWGVLMATFAAASMTVSFYIVQSEVNAALHSYQYFVGAGPARSFLWLPGLVTMSWKEVKLFTVLLHCLSSIAIFLLAARALNLRGFLASLGRGRRLSPLSVALPMIGIFLALVLWNFLVHAGAVIGQESLSFGSTSYFIPEFYRFSGQGPLSLLLMALNPFLSPLTGWFFCGLTYILLFTRCTRGVPSLVLYFYGCLGMAALVPGLTQWGVGSMLHYFWSSGIIGTADIRGFCLSFLGLVAFTGFIAGLMFVLFRFEEGLSLKKRLIPVLSLMGGATLVMALSSLPMATKTLSFEGELMDAARSLDACHGSPVLTHTLVYFKGKGFEGKMDHPVPADPENLFYYRFPRVLENDSVYRDMKNAAGKPERAHSFVAYWYLTARSLEQWDSQAFLNASLERKRLFFTTRYNGQLNWSVFNGMEKKTALDFLSRICDEKLFTQSARQKYFETQSYEALEEPSSASRVRAALRPDQMRELQKAGTIQPFSGSVNGRLHINGLPAKGVQLRLFSAFNFLYYSPPASSLSEQDFFHNFIKTLGGETLFYHNLTASSLARSLVTVGMRSNYLPLITTRTDDKGAFRFMNLARGQYYLVARFPEKLKSAVPKEPLGIIELKEGAMSRDLGTLELQINKEEAAHE